MKSFGSMGEPTQAVPGQVPCSLKQGRVEREGFDGAKTHQWTIWKVSLFDRGDALARLVKDH